MSLRPPCLPLFALTVSALALSACGAGSASGSAPERRPAAPPPLSSIPEGQTPVTRATANAGADAGAQEGATAEVLRTVTAFSRRFSEGHTRAMQPTTGSLESAGNRQYALSVRANRCYLVFGVATASASDLDLVLSDASGAEVESDLSYGTTAMLGIRQPLCFEANALLKLEVRLVYGPGTYAVEVFSTPTHGVPQEAWWTRPAGRHSYRGAGYAARRITW